MFADRRYVGSLEAHACFWNRYGTASKILTFLTGHLSQAIEIAWLPDSCSRRVCGRKVRRLRFAHRNDGHEKPSVRLGPVALRSLRFRQCDFLACQRGI